MCCQLLKTSVIMLYICVGVAKSGTKLQNQFEAMALS